MFVEQANLKTRVLVSYINVLMLFWRAFTWKLNKPSWALGRTGHLLSRTGRWGLMAEVKIEAPKLNVLLAGQQNTCTTLGKSSTAHFLSHCWGLEVLNVGCPGEALSGTEQTLKLWCTGNWGSSDHCCGRRFYKDDGARGGLCASSRSIGVSFLCQRSPVPNVLLQKLLLHIFLKQLPGE